MRCTWVKRRHFAEIPGIMQTTVKTILPPGAAKRVISTATARIK